METNDQVPRPPRPDKPWYKSVAEAASDLRNAGRDFGALLWGVALFLTVISVINSPEDFGKWLKALLPKMPIVATTPEPPKGPGPESPPPPPPSRHRYPSEPQPEPEVTVLPPSTNRSLELRDSITVTIHNASQQPTITAPNPNVINIIINGNKHVFRWDKQYKDTLTYVYVPDTPAVEETETEKSSDVNMIASRSYYKKIFLKIRAVHIIGPGDIYRVVAQKYGISKEVLMRLNNKTLIKAERGDELIIPFPGEKNFHFVFG